MPVAAVSPRVLERLRRVLALARGRGEPAERAAAEELLARQLAKHGLTEQDVFRGAIEEVDLGLADLPVWELAVLQGCASVRGLVLLRRIAGQHQSYRLCGTREHVAEAQYLHMLLVAGGHAAMQAGPLGDRSVAVDRDLEARGWPRIRGQYLSPGGFVRSRPSVDPEILARLRDSFLRGYAAAVRARLRTADFRRQDDEVADVVARAHPQAEKAAAEDSGGSPEAFADGYKAGQAVDIPDPREDDPGRGRARIEGGRS